MRETGESPRIQTAGSYEIAGLYVSDGTTACIGVNEHHPYTRQRFTVAHELGHLIFTDDQDLFVDFSHAELLMQTADPQQQEFETKANQFAADLLMLRTWILQDVAKHSDELDLTWLAKRYEASEQSLWFRLINLKLIDKSDSW